MLVLYGIKTCDTCKKAKAWLETNGLSYRFHDFREDGLTEAMLQQFFQQAAWETLLNKSSTSWRQLSAEQQSNLMEDKVKQLMLVTPTLIKRPVLDTDKELLIGFKADIYQNKLL